MTDAMLFSDKEQELKKYAESALALEMYLEASRRAVLNLGGHDYGTNIERA